MAGPGNPRGTNRGGGWRKGMKARKTLERELGEARELLERYERERLAASQVQNQGKKQPRDVLSDAMQYFFALAAKHQPTPDNADADEKKFEKYLREAADIAAKVAPYVHQKLQALQVTALPLDLSKLTEEELLDLERLHQKASLPGGDSGGNLPPAIAA